MPGERHAGAVFGEADALKAVVGPDEEHGIDAGLFEADVDGRLTAGEEAPDGVFLVGTDAAAREEDDLGAEGVYIFGGPFQRNIDVGLRVAVVSSIPVEQCMVIDI